MKKTLLAFMLVVLSALALVGCGKKNLTDTASIVADAGTLSLTELEAKSKAEFENKADGDVFKVVGLTSVLKSTMKSFAKKYDWIKYGTDNDNVNVKNDYKDYQLLTALDTASDGYFADYALVQDVRSIADYDGELLHNFVPSDWKEIGLKEEDTVPLKGVHFNKIFYTNSNFTNVTGETLYNIWQLAGAETDEHHLTKLSFQTPTTEQINMSFLLSCYAEDNQDRIKAAYKKFYGKDWAATDDYASAGEQWVAEFIANISRWHASDGTAMKETQLKDDWKEGYVYYGAFAKMKDAVGKFYTIEGQAEDPILKDLIITEGENAGKICAMDTVKWDWEIEGFNGFMYTMCSQIVNNAKFPYTACLYARHLLEVSCYEASCYNKKLPAQDGTVGTIAVNQYGYYCPASNDIVYAKGDWKRDVHIAKEINEDYSFLKTIKGGQVNRIIAMCASNKKSSS
ncbi:MAG: hypothetical protein K6G38_04550 [Gammaproteobacteria bacterium]|nr:hypothetical protein [Gammaproteobacteria bacterium]